MSDSPDGRRQKILQWLKEHRSLSIDELVSRLHVSAMTVHRDLDVLAEGGLVQKSYGHVAIRQIQADVQTSSDVCALCRNAVSTRTAFRLHLARGEILTACCPHCGLLLLGQQSQVFSTLTRDFLYGRVVNATQAVYILESSVHLCCVPSVLCFLTLADAKNFQLGFGGALMTFDEILRHLGSHHCHPSSRP